MRRIWIRVSCKEEEQALNEVPRARISREQRQINMRVKRFSEQASNESNFQLICEYTDIGISFLLFMYLLCGDFLRENFWWRENLDGSFILQDISLV